MHFLSFAVSHARRYHATDATSFDVVASAWSGAIEMYVGASVPLFRPHSDACLLNSYVSNAVDASGHFIVPTVDCWWFDSTTKTCYWCVRCSVWVWRLRAVALHDGCLEHIAAL